MKMQELSNTLNAMKKILPMHAPDVNDSDVLKYWLGEFGHLEISHFQAVMQCAARKGNHFPTIKNVWDEIAPKINSRQVGVEVVALIENAMHKVGGYGIPDFSGSEFGNIARQLISEAGGWSQVCELTYDELPMQRAQWRDRAEVMATRSERGQDMLGKKSERTSLPGENSPLSRAMEIAATGMPKK
jgi:hypothetical protein